MKHSLPWIFASFAKNYLLTLRQTVVFVLMILFITSAILFSHNLAVFKDEFIDALRGIYPELFIEGKRLPEKLKANFDCREEYLDVSYDGFIFKYSNASADKSFINVVFRTFNDEMIPKIIKYNYKANDTIYLSSHLYGKIVSSKYYNGSGLYIKSRVPDKAPYKYVSLTEIASSAGNKWIIIKNSLARDLGIGTNIVTLYNEANIEIGTLPPFVVLWYERVPFFSQALYNSTQYLFQYFIVSFLILMGILLFLSSTDMMHEFKKLTQFSSLFGVPRRQLILFLYFLTTAYFVLAIMMAFFLSVLLNEHFIKDIIAGTESNITFPYYYLLLLLGFLFSASIWVVYSIYRKRIAAEDV